MGTSKLQLRHAFIEAPKFIVADLAPRLFFLVATIIGSQILMTGTANSTTVLGGNVQASIVEGSVTLDNPSEGSNTADGHTVSAPQGTYSGPPVGTANATSTVGFIGSPFASVTAGGSVLLDGLGTTISAGGNATLSYTFIVSGPAGPATVPVGIDALVNTTINGGDAFALGEITVAGTNVSRVNGGSFLGKISLNLAPGGTYEVDLTAGASAIGQASASAFVDPHIFIDDPTLASLYSIILPEGVGNDLPPGFGGPTPAVPLPATLPLFATGLGALGLLGWRRKKKAASLAV